MVEEVPVAAVQAAVVHVSVVVALVLVNFVEEAGIILITSENIQEHINNK
jgi:hypothetical protein